MLVAMAILAKLLSPVGFLIECESYPANYGTVSRPSFSSSLGAHSMETSDLDRKNSNSNSGKNDRRDSFSIRDLVKLTPDINGNALPVAELVDPTPFMSTVYTDSINCVSNLIRKFDQHKKQSTVNLNITNPVIRDANSTKPMESDAVTGLNQNEQEIYGSILDLNPNYSISALVAEFNRDINHFCQWGDSEQLHAYWNGLSYAEKEKLLLGLKFKMEPDSDFDSKAETVINNMKYVHNPKKRNKMATKWLKLDLKQKVRMVNRMGTAKIQMALQKAVKKENLATREIKHVKKDYTILKRVANESPVNDVKNAYIGTIDRKKPEIPIVDDQEKKEEGKTEVKMPMSYAEKVGKKKQMANLISVIQKDPKLKVGEVEMPVADTLKGSEPFSTTLYGYFIEKRVNYFNMNKYAVRLEFCNNLVSLKL